MAKGDVLWPMLAVRLARALEICRRTRPKLSSAQFAKIVEITPACLSRVMGGRRVSADNFLRVCKYLEAEPWDFVETRPGQG